MLLNIRMRHLAIAILAAAVACRLAPSAAPSETAPLTLDFDSHQQAAWFDQTSAGDGGMVVVENLQKGGRLQLTAGSGQEKRLVRRIGAAAFRGRRILARTKVEFRSNESTAFAAMKISADRTVDHATAWDSSTSQHITDGGVRVIEAALDVPMDATSLQVELTIKGDGEAKFQPAHLSSEAAPSSEAPLTTETGNALVTLAHLVGYLRFFHPSDESAKLNWPMVEAVVVHRLLEAKHLGELRSVLESFVTSVAPTAQLYSGDRRPYQPRSPRPGHKLTRWVRIGSGSDGEPYSAFRTGVAEPKNVGILLLETTPSLGCKHVSIRLDANIEEGTPVLQLSMFSRRGSSVASAVSHVVDHTGSLEAEVPDRVTHIMYGVQVGGEGVVSLSGVTLSCGSRTLASFASGGAPEIFGTAYHLYSVTERGECAGCLTVSRAPETMYRPEDDIDVDVGFGLRLRMPLVAWTDGIRTYPLSADIETVQAFPPSDRASRIASAIDIWSTLRWFYPYFDDLKIDWSSPLRAFILASGRARTADELLDVLKRMLATLRDDHANVYRPTYDNGILPFVFRQIDSKLYFANGVGAYSTLFPIGSVLESIDGIPADVLMKEVSKSISAATSGWLSFYMPYILADGPAGVLASVRVRQPNGTTSSAFVPRLARSKFLSSKREVHPVSGTEISSGIYYVDGANVDDNTWEALLPKLTASRGVICDLRSGASPAAFQILSHFIGHEIMSPYWDKPIVTIGERRYERQQSSILPRLPRLSIGIVFVVDGGTASSPETILQYARAAGIGYVVGEPTGGTNGDVASFDTLGSLRVRFTGMRTLNPDGSDFHGRGIVPNLLVHPTVAGLRAGRDEILEAAIAHLSSL